MKRPHFSLAMRVALAYALFATGWILFSDLILAALVRDVALLSRLQSLKGGFFVCLTTLLLFVLLSTEQRRRAQSEQTAGRAAKELQVVSSAHTQTTESLRVTDELLRAVIDASPAAIFTLTPSGQVGLWNRGAEQIFGWPAAEVHGQALPIVPAERTGESQQFIARVLAGETLRGIEIERRHRDGVLIDLLLSAAPLRGPGGQINGVMAVLIDISASKEIARALQERTRQLDQALAAEQQARRASEAAEARTARLQTVTAALAATLTPEQVVSCIIDQGIAATGAGAGAVALLDDAGISLEIVAHTGQPLDLKAEHGRFPLNALLPPAVAFNSREAVWIESIAAGEAHFPGMGLMMERFQDAAHATLPLVVADRSLGVLGLGFREERVFNAEDRALMLALAQQAAQALDRARLYSEVQAARARLQNLSQRLLDAQEQERRHIARELHDEVGQVLGALKINLHVLRGQVAAPENSRWIDDSMAMLDQLMQQVRALSLDLRPSVLDDLGLLAALEWYTGRLAQRSGLRIIFHDQVAGLAVPPDIATACFRVAQEALTNIVRHAQASRVIVTLNVHDGMLALSVQDDGVGFEVGASRARALGGASLGLINMLERVDLVGGWADISSSAGVGTEVWAYFPLVTTPGARV